MVDSHESQPQCIRVLVVDDHAAVRHAIATAVEVLLDLEPAGEASDAAEALRLCAQTCPDVILLDVSLPDMSCVDTIRAMLDCCPSSRIIATCTFQEEKLIPEALRAGAVGYMLKNVSLKALGATIRAAYAMIRAEADALAHEQEGVKNPQVESRARPIHRAAVHKRRLA